MFSIFKEGSSSTHKLNPSLSHEWLLVFIALIIVLEIFAQPYGFIQGSHRAFLDSHGLALAKSLDITWPFLMSNGAVENGFYNRFPSGSFWVIKGALSLFDNELAKYEMAKTLMRVFASGSLATLFVCLRILQGSKATALLSVLLVSSGYTFMHYHDMVFNDVPTLFAQTLFILGSILLLQHNNLKIYVILSSIGFTLGSQQVFPMFIFSMYILFLWNKQDQLTWKRFFILAIPGFVFLVSMGSGVISEYLFSGSVQSLGSLQYRLGLDLDFNKTYATHIGWGSYLLTWIISSAVSTPILSLSFMLYGLLISVKQKNIFILIFVIGIFLYSILFRRFLVFHDFQWLHFLPTMTLLCFIGISQIKKLIIINILTSFSIAFFGYQVYETSQSKLKNSPISTFSIVEDLKKLTDISALKIQSDIQCGGFHCKNYFFPKWRNGEMLENIEITKKLNIITANYSAHQTNGRVLSNKSKFTDFLRSFPFFYTLKAYVRKLTLNEVFYTQTPLNTIKPNESSWSNENALWIHDNTQSVIVFDKLQRGSKVNVSVSNNDGYLFEFRLEDEIVFRQVVKLYEDIELIDKQSGNLQNTIIAFKEELEFDSIRVIPAGGDGLYAVGHLCLRISNNSCL